jgi:hypothetical protein
MIRFLYMKGFLWIELSFLFAPYYDLRECRRANFQAATRSLRPISTTRTGMQKVECFSSAVEEA